MRVVAGAESLPWHRPAAAVVFRLLQQIGGSPYKSKTTPPRFLCCFEAGASVALRLVGKKK